MQGQIQKQHQHQLEIDRGCPLATLQRSQLQTRKTLNWLSITVGARKEHRYDLCPCRYQSSGRAIIFELGSTSLSMERWYKLHHIDVLLATRRDGANWTMSSSTSSPVIILAAGFAGGKGPMSLLLVHSFLFHFWK